MRRPITGQPAEAGQASPSIEELMNRGNPGREPGTGQIPGGPSSRGPTAPPGQPAGLAEAAMAGDAPPGGAQPGAAAAQGQAPAFGEQPPTGPEQAVYDEILMEGESRLYSGKLHSKFVQMLEAKKDDPVTAISDTTLLLWDSLDQESGGKIPTDVIPHAAGELTERVGQLANDTGTFAVDQNVIGKASHKVQVGLAERYGAPQPAEIQGLMDSVGPDEIERMRAQEDSYYQTQNALDPAEGLTE